MSEVSKQELRRLAEAAHRIPDEVEWYSFAFDAYEEDKRFIAAANPAAILSLLDELDASSTSAWQEKCLKHGFEYVRESDDHYVVADPAEMVSLLRDLLGLDIRQKDSSDYGQSVSELQEQIEGLVNTIHSLDQCRKDAERYRALRSYGRRLVVRDNKCHLHEVFLDHAIDAEMTKEGGANG